MIFNIVKAFGLINCILAAILTLCTVFLLVVIYACLCFLFGF